MDQSVELQLSRVDLNLLVPLKVLLKEKNVSRAAEQLFVSQSAMSRTLAKLRELFNDELFTRTSKGIIPTAKALELEILLAPILNDLQSLFLPFKFNPSTSEMTFNISIPAFISSTLTPPMTIELMGGAPSMSIIESSAKSDPFTLLDSGKLDFAFHYSRESNNKYCSEHMMKLFPIIYARKDHPLFDVVDLQRDRLFEYPFIGMSVETTPGIAFASPIQRFLNHSPNIKKPSLQSSQTKVLIDVANQSNALVFGSNFTHQYLGSSSPLQQLCSFSDTVEYHVDVFLIQHVRNRNNDAHNWFKNLLRKHIGSILDNSGCNYEAKIME